MRIIAPLTTLICLVGCTQLQNKPASPPEFPAPSLVARIEILGGGEPISSPKEIEEFLGELREIQTDWSFTWATYPTPQESIVLMSNENRPLCRIDFGPKWIGSNCGQKQGGSPLAETSAEQDQYFQTILGQKWPH